MALIHAHRSLTLPVRACMLLAAILFPAGCGPAAPPPVDEARLDELTAELNQRYTPGLHSLMVDLGLRHASLWFAGAERNWALADYMVHELEELIEDIGELHPVYRDVRVAELIVEMTSPTVQSLDDAIEAGDREAFARAYDDLTTACNGCHIASDRAWIVIQRPESPPLTNLRFRP